MSLPAQINLFSGEERTVHPRQRNGKSRILTGQTDRLRQLFTLGIDYDFPPGKYSFKDLTIDDGYKMIARMENRLL